MKPANETVSLVGRDRLTLLRKRDGNPEDGNPVSAVILLDHDTGERLEGTTPEDIERIEAEHDRRRQEICNHATD